MADKNHLDNLTRQNERILAFDRDSLVSRQKWGEITFEEARSDFDRVFWVASQVRTYPVEVLPNQVVSTFTQHLQQVAEQLDQIDKFSITQGGDPNGRRNTLMSQLRQHTDQLYMQCAPWIPFLAHQKGDVVRNIEALSKNVRDAEAIIADAKSKIEAREKEMEGIIQAAREASAGAGAAVFTKDFETAADKLEDGAGTWLKVTIASAVATLLLSGGMWLYTEGGLDQGQLIQKLSTKLFILALLITATVWCGRNYKALKHLATINRHRALSLRTLQAFAAAASDQQAKDAVLLEATRAVFGSVPTGFIDGANSDSELKVVEIARSVLPKSSQA